MGIRKNFAFSTVLTLSNYIFPFIVYPYVARVLGVANIGMCNFVDGIVNYASMFSLMGISIIGVRDIAKAKGDRRVLDATFTSLMLLCTVFTLVATVGLVTVTYAVPAFTAYRPLLLIGIIKLWGNFLIIDWFYRGLEDFKYITKRTILVKTAYVICVFLFVRAAQDYAVYYLLTCLVVAVNSLFSGLRACRIVSLHFDRALTMRLLRPFVVLGVYIFLNSLYLTFNVIWLGFVGGDTQVGYYTTATKVFQLILAVYTAYSGVIMPRASAMLKERRTEEFRALIGKSVDVLITFAVPAVMFTMLFSRGVVLLIAGEGYEGAIVPMTIVMPLIFIIGYEQILVVQILTPMSSDRKILINSVVGATVGVVGNLALVSGMLAVGSAIVWVLAEVAVLISAQRFVTRATGIRFPWRGLLRRVGVWMPYPLMAAALLLSAPLAPIPMMLAGGLIAGVYFVLVEFFWLKNPLLRIRLSGRKFIS